MLSQPHKDGRLRRQKVKEGAAHNAGRSIFRINPGRQGVAETAPKQVARINHHLSEQIIGEEVS